MYSHQFIKCSLQTIKSRPGHIFDNAEAIIAKSKATKASIVAFTELVLTGYSNGDLFLNSQTYLDNIEAIKMILEATKDLDKIIIFGSIFRYHSQMYNVAYVIEHGHILGIVPKSYLPIAREFGEERFFRTIDMFDGEIIDFLGDDIYFGQQVFVNHYDSFKFGVEICADMWATVSPSQFLSEQDAQIVFNLSASTYAIGKASTRSDVCRALSIKNQGCFVYVAQNTVDSSYEVIFDNCKIAYQMGAKLADIQASTDNDEEVLIDVDLQRIANKRLQNNYQRAENNFVETEFELMPSKEFEFENTIDANPFVTSTIGKEEEIIHNLAHALKLRMDHLNINDLVLGLSGGLDSTLTMYICLEALKLKGLDAKHLHAYILAMNHSSKASIQQATQLATKCGVDLVNLNIDEEVHHQLDLINHDLTEDIAFENAQARYRTYTLLNIANMKNALMVGTSDMSEIALGFSTFGGDHLSHINIIGGLPKTVVKYLTLYLTHQKSELKDVLEQIANKAYSPELKSSKQVTEDIVGKYEINDFIMAYLLQDGGTIDRVKYLLSKVYPEVDADEAVSQFVRRFKNSQFKRNTAADAIKIFDLCLNASTFKAPSDL